MSGATGKEGLFGLALERDLLEEMTAEGASQAYLDEADWKRLRAKVCGIDLSDSGVAERTLGACAAEIRRLLLERGHRIERSHLRSADLRTERSLPSSGTLPQAYERSVESRMLEQKLGASVVPAGWSHETLAFSSGMASLPRALVTVRYMLRSERSRPFMAAWSSYFETDALLRIEYGDDEYVKLETITHASRELAGRRPDVLLVEPVRYNWALDVLDFTALMRLVAEAQTRPRVLIVDKTLTPTWSTSRLLTALSSMSEPPLVLEIRSGLKLDQQGLEVANLGVVEVFSRDRSSVDAAQVAELMRLVRATSGTALDRAALASLDVPFLLEESWRSRHGGSVLMQNAWMADRVAGLEGGIIEEIVHPSLREASGGHAPFIVMRLGTDDLSDHGFFLAALRQLLGERAAAIQHGSSFGFRGTRYETIIPRLADAVGLFKIAVGSRGGPSLGAFLEVLNQLASARSFTAMRQAMPTLKEVVLR